MGLSDEAHKLLQQQAAEAATSEANRRARLRRFDYAVDESTRAVLGEFVQEVVARGIQPEPLYEVTYSRQRITKRRRWFGSEDVDLHTYHGTSSIQGWTIGGTFAVTRDAQLIHITTLRFETDLPPRDMLSGHHPRREYRYIGFEAARSGGRISQLQPILIERALGLDDIAVRSSTEVDSGPQYTLHELLVEYLADHML
jgi:hypothetical protein